MDAQPAGKEMQVDWSRTSQKNGSVTFCPCASGGKPILLRLEDVRIAFEPSCYGGDGTELRKNICFANAPEDIKQIVGDMEQSLAFNPPCCSVLKDDLLKAKVSVDKVRIFDADRNRVEPPKTWRGWQVNAVIKVRGKWETRTQCGLCLELTDVQLLHEASEAVCPF